MSEKYPDFSAVHGRRAIALIKELLGIDCPGVREIHIHAQYDDVALFTVEGVAKFWNGASVEPHEGNEQAYTKRYTVTVTPIEEAE